mmetsp:Transcript_94064/g.303887  ORF Transcript_94064/g.303887 Transcript_94064/m.303887 type:complete len:230 (-) Transcript_94064:204-893(-)
MLAMEGHVTEQQDEDDHPHAPEVAFVGVARARQDLRRHVRQRAAAQFHLPVVGGVSAKAEVDELQVVEFLGIIQKVLQLDVSVDDALGVQVVGRQQDLVHGVRGVPLAEPVQLLDPLEELPAHEALHDQPELALVLVDVCEPGHVRVVHGQEDLQFVPQLALLPLRESVQLEGLHGVLELVGLGGRQVHSAVVARAEALGLHHIVVFEPLWQPVVTPSDLHEVQRGRGM